MAYQSSLHRFLQHAQQQPDKTFLNQPVAGRWQQYSFTDVEQQARRMAQGLVALGLNSGDRVGIISKNCAHWFIADLAIMMAGMVSVPIYATAGEKTISYVMEHSDMKALFVGRLDDYLPLQQVLSDTLPIITMPYPDVAEFAASNNQSWESMLADHQPMEQIATPDLLDTMTLCYTSGTTGNPKGVVITYKNIASAAKGAVDVIGIAHSGPQRVVSYLPLAHITERGLIEGIAYELPLEVFFIDSLDTFISDVQHAQPTFFLSVPRLWVKFQAQILKAMPQKKLNVLLSLPIIGNLVAKKIRAKLGLDNVQVFGCGSAPVSEELLKWYQRLGMNIGEGWGMTETSGLSCGNLPFEESRIGTIGKALPCVEMKLSAEQEIMIRGDAVFTEYYLAPETTKQAFTDGWFHTGDKGELNGDGDYKIVGRIKEQFKTAKGKYVVPVPIERLLLSNSALEQACVIGSGMKQPIALVVLSENAPQSQAEQVKLLATLLEQVNAELESHQRLDYIMVCLHSWKPENELLTPTLKLKRNEIEQYYVHKLPTSVKQPIVFEE
ncbi:AMP-dependent synthetase [Thalassotalea litorea]|uniref:AMP-dependent synthetase n=1 Tax=Thalassotalea litorea TaxID=2020715 RepID=A0A5R9IPS3_9GAMM|nr:AMP-binding protein [Thalassotalea litorea]TLU67544.1 AMP-dependent synthetase [Thalassotalea litorea]